MADDMFGGLIGAAGSLLGGYFSNQYNKKAAQTAFQQQFDAQNFFNQHAIQQKVSDAKAAGISPEFAMGAGTVSAPSMSAFSDSLGPAMASAGQNIGRAVTANMDANGKKMAELAVEGAELDVAQKREELNRMRAAGSGPAVGGQDDADRQGPFGRTKGPELSGLRWKGMQLYHAPDTSDAQDFNNRYDDAVSEMVGTASFPRDLTFTMAINGDLGRSAFVKAWNMYTKYKGGTPHPMPRPDFEGESEMYTRSLSQ